MNVSRITKLVPYLEIFKTKSYPSLFHPLCNFHNLIQCKTNKERLSLRLNNKICFYSKDSNKIKFNQNKSKQVTNVNELFQFIKDDKQFYLKLLVNIFDSIEFDKISMEQAKLLLNCCGNSVADSSKESRNKICQNIYQSLLKHKKLDVDAYNLYVKICTENGAIARRHRNPSNLKPVKETYKLLIGNVCEKGVSQELFELLDEMKTEGFPADEDVFNKLLLAHVIQGGLETGNSVLEMMKIAQVPESRVTKFNVLKGLLKKNDAKEFAEAVEKYPIRLDEDEILEFLEVLGLNGDVSWLKKIKPLYNDAIFGKTFFKSLEKLCVHLVYLDKGEVSIAIYREFVEPRPDQSYAFFILKEMLHFNMDMNRLLPIVESLKEVDSKALSNLTHLSLSRNYVASSWKLLESMKQLKPFFFWPLLLNAEKNGGEAAVLEVVEKMLSLNVKVDFETLQFYVLPFCDQTNPEMLVQKLQNFGLGARDLMNPLLVTFSTGKAEEFKLRSKIDDSEALLALSSVWKSNKNAISLVLLLRRYLELLEVESDRNLLGDFLVSILNDCSNKFDFQKFRDLLKEMNETRFKIDPGTVDLIYDLIFTRCSNSNLCDEIKEQTDMLIDLGIRSSATIIPHPNRMDANELENHLLELREKNMNTRGVLRKLIQKNLNLENFSRVEELRKEFLDSGFQESTGMKSSLMHSFVKHGRLDSSMELYREIRDSDPRFSLDEFKVVDLCALLVKEKRSREALELLEFQSAKKKPLGGVGLKRNCLSLLNSFDDAIEQKGMFEFLVGKGYCKPSNVILGPLVKIYLKSDLKKATKVYLNCASKYRCTPLQLELIRELTKARKEDLLERVLAVTENIHGVSSTRATLIAALAENGQVKEIKKMLALNKVDIKKNLEKKCERWVKENKLDALLSLGKACERLNRETFDVAIVHRCIIQFYGLKNDCKSAMEFHDYLLQSEAIIDKKMESELQKLLKLNDLRDAKNVN